MIARLLVLLVTASLPLAGDADEDITSVVSTLASALSQNDPGLFLRHLDHGMADYRKIEQAVTSLAADTQIGCSIDLISNSGTDTGQQADLDWYMVLRSQQDQNLIERRRTKVTIKMEKRGKKWIVTGFSPVSVFDAMKMGMGHE
jgi:hypothetical protein